MTRRAAMAAPVTALAFAVAFLVAACAPGTSRTTYPPAGSTPRPVGDATNATRQAVIGALASAGMQASESTRTFRPPEGPLLAAASRSVLQVALPDDPDHGFIAIYALGSPNAALAAANDHAAWVASPSGRMSFPLGARFVVRVVGSTVVWFWWLPGASPDSRLDQVGSALETIGEGITIPS